MSMLDFLFGESNQSSETYAQTITRYKKMFAEDEKYHKMSSPILMRAIEFRKTQTDAGVSMLELAPFMVSKAEKKILDGGRHNSGRCALLQGMRVEVIEESTT
jgi:hypothetical protein